MIKKHISLLILVAGGVSIYLVNIILKDILGQDDYGKYALFISYLSILSSFGLFALNQTFLRITENIKNNSIIVPKNFFISFLIAPIFSSTLFSICFILLYDIGVNFIVIFLISLSNIYLLAFFTIYRNLRLYVLSQLQRNGWKILLLILVGFIFFVYGDINDIVTNSIIFNIILIVHLFGFIIGLISIFLFANKRIKYKNQNIKAGNITFSFMLNVGIMTYLNYADRFFIENYFGINELGNYFFIQNIILYPFNQLQAYIGFKQINYFKDRQNLTKLNKGIKKTLIFSLLVALIMIFIAIILDNTILDIKVYDNLILIFFFLFWGVIKLIYALLSSAMGAQGTANAIYKVNLVTAISIVFVFLILPFFSININMIIITLISIWLIRIIAFKKELTNMRNK